MNNNKTMDMEKVEIVGYIYKQDWHKMGLYDQDRDNIEWHVDNCMTYIIVRSEDRESQWRCPPDLELDEDWTESELLALYQDLLDAAEQAGYKADPGMMTRVRRAFSPVWKRAVF